MTDSQSTTDNCNAAPLPPIISLEDHFLSRAAPASVRAKDEVLAARSPDLVPALEELGARRLGAMDTGGVCVQVVSHSPGLCGESAEVCAAANDQLHTATTAPEHGGRFKGFAVLPMLHPLSAAQELRRCVEELGFVGALIDNHCAGVFYDDPSYDAFWRAAEALGVPVYLHPTWSEPAMEAVRYTGASLSSTATMMLGGFGWGWHSDTAVHFLRLLAAGVFDQFPTLQVVLGHMGEMLPFMHGRLVRTTKAFKLERSFEAVWGENVWLTTSGNWSLDPLRCLLHNTSPRRVMYSVDYPFQDHDAGRGFLLELRSSGLVTDDQFEDICYRNAQRLLKIAVPARP